MTLRLQAKHGSDDDGDLLTSGRNVWAGWNDLSRARRGLISEKCASAVMGHETPRPRKRADQPILAAHIAKKFFRGEESKAKTVLRAISATGNPCFQGASKTKQGNRGKSISY